MNKKYISLKILIVLMTGFLPGYGISQQKMVSYQVAGACEMCRDRIEEVSLKTIGVKSAFWNIKTGKLSLEISNDRFNEEELHKNLAFAGHDTEKAIAPDDIYESLPACCHYRDPENPHKKEMDVQGTKSSFLLRGKVAQLTGKGKQEGLPGANIIWLENGQGASSGMDGSFEIEKKNENDWLVISYIGFRSDTLLIDTEMDELIEIVLIPDNYLETVEIRHRRRATEISAIDPIKTFKITERELHKAACCNLSESFETNPSIDVSFSDAVTGARIIEMLGLAGKYVQITRELIPEIRGLSAIQGLTYTPGPWIEGIQMNMGTGSVVNGFESMTGQINVELRKPEQSDLLYLNLFGSKEGRMEANLNLSHDIIPIMSTGLLLHGNLLQKPSDHNKDGFADNPTGTQLIAVNRWKLFTEKGLEGQFGIKATILDKMSGQTAFLNDEPGNQHWGATMKTNRFEAWLKTGKVLRNEPLASIGFQLAGVSHTQSNLFGERNYDGKQQSLFANLIYQSVLGSEKHGFKTGLSFLWDLIDENVAGTNYTRNEWIPGTYFEYTFLPNDHFSLVAGLRADLHNNYGFLFNPRLNIRYAPTEQTTIRFAGGKGNRTASIFAENIGHFASSRQFLILNVRPGLPYGLEIEESWNFGMNLTQTFRIAGKDLILSADGYHTRFENQVIVDLENPRLVRFYNLEGKSFSNSLQFQAEFSPFRSFDLRLAYRFNDAKTTFSGELLEKPLSSRHRAFINAAYAINNGWKFDATVRWQGKKRIPDTSDNPEIYQLDEYSKGYYLINAHISKSWKEHFELYAGGENLLNFKQHHPIIAADEAFGPYFDSSLIWGPVMGMHLYAGLRYRIGRE